MRVESLHNLLVSMQFAVVLFLALASLQAAREFKEEASFWPLFYGWVVNFLYLVLSAKFLSLPPSLRGTDQIADLLASLLLWRTSIVGTSAVGKNSLTRRWALLLIFLFCFLWYEVALHSLSQTIRVFFVLTTFPIVLVGMIARFHLSSHFRRLEDEFNRNSRPTRLLSGGAFLYALIQPLHFAGNLGDAIGFALGLGAKSLIFFGLFHLFAANAAKYMRAMDEEDGYLKRQREIRRVGHELGTPIGEILSYTPELARVVPHRGLAPNLIAATENAGLRMAAILDASHLISLDELRCIPAAMEKGTISSMVEQQVLSVNTLVQIAVMAVKATRTESVKFSFSYSRQCCLRCRPGDVVQIVINVLRNAYDSLPDGEGRVSVKTENLRYSNEGIGSLRVVVEDDGEGISASAKESAFKEGFSTRAGVGRGHGLHIALDLARRNGGRLELISPIDSRNIHRPGTRAVVTFPRVACQEQ